jgi:2-polyprenyl-6-methoxyphenol hydroxylase-like FAD-dependent oxidoreductase
MFAALDLASGQMFYRFRRLAGVDLSDSVALTKALEDFEEPRKPHTARQSQQAYVLGQVFHHAPRPLQVLRDTILDRTPLLQKVVGESSPNEIVGQIAEIDRAEEAFIRVRPAGRG